MTARHGTTGGTGEDMPSRDEVEHDFSTPADPDVETGTEPDQPA